MDNFKEIWTTVTKFAEDHHKKIVEEQEKLAALQASLSAYESESVKELIAALSLARNEFSPIYFSALNTFTDDPHATLQNIMDAIVPSLEKHKLFVDHRTEIQNDGKTMLVTKVTHVSGEWKKTVARIIPSSEDYNAYMSAINIYAVNNLKLLLGLTATNDPSDDDGVKSMKHMRDEKARGTSPTLSYKPKEMPTCITPEQLDELTLELEHFPDQVDDFLRDYKIQHLADLPKDRFRSAINRVREVKGIRYGK